MRARVAGFTLAGSSKYFDRVGRDTPDALAKSSIVRWVFSAIDMSSPFARARQPSRSGQHQSCGRCREAALLDRICSVKFLRFQYNATELRASNYLLTLQKLRLRF